MPRLTRLQCPVSSDAPKNMSARTGRKVLFQRSIFCRLTVDVHVLLSLLSPLLPLVFLPFSLLRENSFQVLRPPVYVLGVVRVLERPRIVEVRQLLCQGLQTSVLSAYVRPPKD